MNSIKLTAIKTFFRIIVNSDISGRLRIKISNFNMIPKAGVEQSLGYIPKAFSMLSGIKSVEPNPKIGSLLIHYDPSKTNTAQILDDIDLMVDMGVQYAPKVMQWEEKDPQLIEDFFVEKFQEALVSSRKVGNQ